MQILPFNLKEINLGGCSFGFFTCVFFLFFKRCLLIYLAHQSVGVVAVVLHFSLVPLGFRRPGWTQNRQQRRAQQHSSSPHAGLTTTNFGKVKDRSPRVDFLLPSFTCATECLALCTARHLWTPSV